MSARSWQVCALAALLALALPAAAQYSATTSDYLAEMDSNRDHRVSLEEYQEHLSAVFRAMDRNGNGVVDLAEFDPAVVGARTRPISIDQHRRQLADVFRRQDSDRSGFLDVRELGAPPR